jgi:hypothetical protein
MFETSKAIKSERIRIDDEVDAIAKQLAEVDLTHTKLPGSTEKAIGLALQCGRAYRLALEHARQELLRSIDSRS